MNSLEELNTYGNTRLTYTDLRAAKITFDRDVPTNQTVSYATADYFTAPIGINILELTIPEYEKVYYEIDVSIVSGATVSWPHLPDGYDVEVLAPGLYRVSNIQTKEDWDLIKEAQVTMPSGYELSFTFTSKIGYEDTKEKAWSTYAINTSKASLSASYSLSISGRLAQKVFSSELSSSSSLSISFTVGRYYFLYSNTSMSTIPTKVPGYVTNMTNRSFIANSPNQLFATNTPRITDDTPNASYTFVLNCPKGRFSLSGTSVSGVSGNNFSYSGTLAQVNAYFAQIYFWPDAGWESSTSITYTQKVNGSTQYTKTITMSYTSTYVYNNVYTFNNSATWTPSSIELLYGKADILVVGGGGGGINAGGGGGGVKEVFNQSLVNQTYTITVGYGGAGGSTVLGGPPAGSWTYSLATAGTGGTSSVAATGITTISATGGTGARLTGDSYNGNFISGNSGTPALGGSQATAFAGRSSAYNFTSNSTFVYGGAGAGARSDVTTNGNYLAYAGPGGVGYQSTITNNYYGGGGGASDGSGAVPPTFPWEGRLGLGGTGGGGRGASGSQSDGYPHSPTTLTHGVANTGGGGGGVYLDGTYGSTTTGGDGGSGIVVIKVH